MSMISSSSRRRFAARTSAAVRRRLLTPADRLAAAVRAAVPQAIVSSHRSAFEPLEMKVRFASRPYFWNRPFSKAYQATAIYGGADGFFLDKSPGTYRFP